MQTYFAKIKKIRDQLRENQKLIFKEYHLGFLLSFWLAMRLYSKNKHRGQLRRLAELLHDLAKQARSNLDNQVLVSGQKLY